MKPRGLLFGVLLAFGLLAQTALAADDNLKVLTDMFAWWNGAYASRSGFTREEFARYYSPDAVIYMNGQQRAKGLTDITRHFQDMRRDAEKVIVWLPFEEGFVSGDHVFTYHLITAQSEGRLSCWHVMGYAVIKGGKISTLNFVSVSEAAPAPGHASACPSTK